MEGNVRYEYETAVFVMAAAMRPGAAATTATLPESDTGNFWLKAFGSRYKIRCCTMRMLLHAYESYRERDLTNWLLIPFCPKI